MEDGGFVSTKGRGCRPINQPSNHETDSNFEDNIVYTITIFIFEDATSYEKHKCVATSLAYGPEHHIESHHVCSNIYAT